MLKNINSLIEYVKCKPKKRIALACAEALDLLQLVEQSDSLNLAEFILVGDHEKITEIASKNNIKLASEIINEPDHAKAAEKCVQFVRDKQADTLMKGMLHTSIFLKAVLNKEYGLNAGRLISQISVFDKEYGDGLQFLTDCAIAIEPTLEDKKQIVENAIDLARRLGYEKPRVAILSALEVVNPAIKDTVDAAALSKMGDRGQIKYAIIDGPFALDNAISPEAAEEKGISGQVAGNADILVVPNLQVGNTLTKALTYYAHKDVAAAIMGATAPVIMTSRSDFLKNKLLSIALAAYLAF